MDNNIFMKTKVELGAKPKQITNLTQWLFIVINTAKSIIDNTSKSNLDIVIKFADCDSTSQIQQEFDIIQGKFGRENFSQRYSPNYLYLCSLVANYPDQILSNRDRELIKQYSTNESYLLYEI